MIPTGLEVLSAMITPAVLISASGTLVLRARDEAAGRRPSAAGTAPPAGNSGFLE